MEELIKKIKEIKNIGNVIELNNSFIITDGKNYTVSVTKGTENLYNVDCNCNGYLTLNEDKSINTVLKIFESILE